MADAPQIRPARAEDAAGIAATLRDLGWFAQNYLNPLAADLGAAA
jgi:hypothetical protein